jgi:membrane-bound lytic murein transglycosylase D
MARVFVAFLLLVSASHAKPPVVESHDLQCNDAFPCPPEIHRRVDFWIKVFRTWGTDQIVFHDRAHPARVYSVITSKATCRHSRSAHAVEAERKRVEQMLRTVAKKATWAKPGWTREERAYLDLFPNKDPDEIAGAANRVRCQEGNRDRFQEALKRYGRYKNIIIDVLKKYNLSEDILYLPFVESAYNPQAYSSAGAAGLWQIMPATARKLGLQLDATMDERFDPHRATLAAVKYLRRSTDVLTEVARELDGSVKPAQVNPFVITSYNYGITGMARAIRSVGPDYIDVLDKYRSQSFRTAVRNFYASFLAARYVARNADKYFGKVETDDELDVAQVVLKQPTSVERIVRVFGVGEDTIKGLNPALTRYVWKGWRLMPGGYALNIPRRAGGWDKQVSKLEQLPPEQPQLSGRKYVVARGDTACEIAKAFSVHCRDLIQLNSLGRRALIRVGQKLDIPGQPKPTASQRVASAQDGHYVVRKGDTACEIARSFRMDCRQLIRVNGLGSRAIIHIGQKLRIPGLEGKTQVAKAEPKAGKDAEGSAGDEQAESGAGPENNGPIPDLMAEIDVAVRVVQADGKTRYLARVLPEETLGHYADWLGLGGTRELRKMNNISSSGELRSGEAIELPISDDTERLAFESDRFEFHQTLVDEFNQHYTVTGVDDYTVKPGDTLWRIAERHNIPYWVLRRINHDTDSPRIGETVRVPVVAARREDKKPMVENNQSE